MKNELIEAIDDLLDINLINGVPFYDQKEHGKLLLNIIDVLKEDFSLKKQIIKNFESEEVIYADLVSALDSPGCSCRARVSNFFVLYWSKSWNKVKSLFDREECDEAKLNRIIKGITSTVHSINTNFSKKQTEEIAKENNPSNIENNSQPPQNNADIAKIAELSKNSFLHQQNQLNNIQNILNNLSKSTAQSRQTKPKPMGLSLAEFFNIIPNVEDIQGLHVTIQVSDYKKLFDYIKQHKKPYSGIHIESEEDMLNIFFY